MYGNSTTYQSIDTVTGNENAANFPIEFLNSLDIPGFSLHILKLKHGVPIILLGNIDPPRLFNGTRIAAKYLRNNIIEATNITGNYKGNDILIPCIPMIPTDMPSSFKRTDWHLQ